MAQRARKPTIHSQGKCVVERAGSALLIMFADGGLTGAVDTTDALRQIRRWYWQYHRIDAINVGLIEWRDGLTPPSKGG